MLVHLAHPVYGEVLRAGTPALRARRRQRQLADVVEQTGARRADDWLCVATWRLASGTTLSPQVLLAAAGQAWALLDLDLAEQMAQTAFQAGAKLEASKILWPVMMLQDRIDEGLSILAGLDDAATTDAERAKLAVARAYLYWGYDPDDAHLRVIDEALTKIADSAARSELQAMQSAMYAHACKFLPAIQLADDLLGRSDPSATVLAYVHLTKAMAQLFHGDTTAAAAGIEQVITVHAQAAEYPWIGPVALVWQCQAQLLGGEFTAATDAAEAAYQRGLGSGSNMVVGLACLSRGQVCRARGQLQQAMRWLREGLAVLREDRGFVSQLLGELAHTAALLGDHATAEDALAEADATRRHHFIVYHLWIDLARPWVTAARGDLTEAIRQALQIAAAMREADALVYEAVALHDAARLGAAAKVADRLSQLAQHSTSVLIQSYATHAAALVDHDAAQLERTSTNLEALGALLLSAETAAEASRAYRRAGRADSARRMAARAAALMTKCDGATTPALHALHAPDLTPRQWEIVKLAAAGLTNEEIADRLVVSIRTVHNHLHQAYARLGVRGRTDLASILQVAPPGGSR
jgi:ATP/maltotriose-dependent transcriptional regulator MalT